MKNIVMTGSPDYQDRVKIKDTIFELKNRFGSDLRITSRGDMRTSDYSIKKYCLFFGIEYAEMPTFDKPRNRHCVEGPTYNAKWSMWKIRDSLLSKQSDMLIVFLDPNELVSKYTEFLIHEFEKKSKPILIIH